MEVVRGVIEDELHLSIPIVVLSKINMHRTSEILFGFPPQTVGIKQGTPLFHLLENIQDEVHRFAITYQRTLRQSQAVRSQLDQIPGIGEKRRTALLQTFKSLKRVREATIEELEAAVPHTAAQAVYDYFHSKQEEQT